MLKKLIITAISSVAMTSATLVVAAPAAHARCADHGEKSVTVGSIKRIWIPTNLHSDWLKGPGTIKYSKRSTAKAQKTVTGEIKGSVGAALWKVEAKAGIELTTGWSKSKKWTYSLKVPRNKTARMRLYHLGYQAKVKVRTTTTGSDGRCKVVVTKGKVKLPARKNENLWKLQYA